MADENEKKETAERVDEPSGHFGHGVYYIAPDSAKPLPETMWNRIDYLALDASVARLNAEVEATRAVTALSGRAPTIFRVPDDRRLYLTGVGGDAVEAMLSELDELDGVEAEQEQRPDVKISR
jgi:hypothetical protein